MTQLLVVGGGRMGSALLGGLLKGGFVEPGECAVVEAKAETRKALAQAFPGVEVTESPIPAEAAILAVKPADLETACRALPGGAYGRILSIVAGATTGRLESLLPPGAVVIRAMPNTPALVGEGASAISAGSKAGDDDLLWAKTVLSAIGVVVVLPEHLLDAVTGLSGSGPAYVFLVAEALIEAGVLQGIDRSVSHTLVIQTLLGAARMLAEGSEGPEALRHGVTSPGGTTAAGLQVLERAGLRAAFLDAVTAATAKSRALGAN